MKKHPLFSLLAALALALMVGAPPFVQPAQAAGTASLTTFGSPYTQDFDTLASSGTSSVVPTGWDFIESGTNANTIYTAGNGSSNTGDTYSFGASGSSERAFGGLLSGSLIPTIGASFTNNTGGAITQLAISFTGEQWRLGATGRTDRLDFQYSTDASSLTQGTWTDVNELDFNGPISAGTVGSLDGNAAANRAAVSFNITGLAIPNGATFRIRWTDFNASGADDSLAVDDFSLTPHGSVAVADPKINEFSANTAGTDVEYVEIVGDPNTDYSTYKVLEIEGDSGAAAGTVDEVVALGTADANGLYLVNLPANALENGAITLLLVKNFTGALNADLDTDNDGVFDVTPWHAIVDAVAVNDGGAGDVAYGVPALGVAYDGLPFAPGGASRIPDGADTDTAADWVRNDFDLAGIPGFDGTPIGGEAYNTPGALNQVVTPPAPQLVINEVDYDQPGTDAAEFVEIRNNGSLAVSLDGWTLELVNGSGGGAVLYNTLTLPAVSLAAGDYFVVCANAATVVNCDLDASPNTDFIQNGAPDAVGLRHNGALMDAISYEGNTGAPYTEGSGDGLVDTAAAAQSISRCPDGADTDINNVDFVLAAITPGAANACVDDAPAVTGTFPINGTIDFPVNADLTVTFSEPVDVAGAWFDLVCSTSGIVAATVSGGPTTFTLNPNSDLVGGETCTLSVYAAGVSDQDANDPPDNMAADLAVGFSTLNICALTFTPIYDIQGSGPSTPIPGNITTQGVVVGDYEGTSPALRGFYIQDVTGDGNPATSDGIFVFHGNNDNVSLGDVVRVTGTAAEFQDQTQISATSVVKCGAGTVDPVDVTFPVPSTTYLEQFEGMLIRLPQTMYVTEHFQLGRFGQVVLSSGGRLMQPTNIYAPGPDADALQGENNLNRIIIDDASQTQNPDPIVFARGGLPLSAANTLRGGDTAADIVGVLTYTWGGNSASPNAYRVRPFNALNGSVNFEAANPRPMGAPELAGRLRVAGMNLLNFFNTFSGCTLGVGGGATDCRGAETPTEFDRQWPKTVAAILGTKADVVGLVELENDGYGQDSALQYLVDELNAATAPGTYAFIDVDAGTGQVNALGADAIKVGLIYQPARVNPVGTTAALNTVDFVNGGDGAPRNRPALAQAFEEIGTGARFVVAVNHLKSKGSACDVPDPSNPQGECNIVRTNAANLLRQWLAADPTQTGDPDAVIVGDLNAYAMEDPIAALKTAGYTDLKLYFGSQEAYSYVFDGQWGYLDHALSSHTLTPQVVSVTDWHINADEPSVLDYNTNFKSAGHITSLYAPDVFRISDHDPVLIDLNPVNDPPAANAGGPYTADEGQTVALSATGSDPDGTAVTFAWDLNNDNVFETPGQTATFSAVDGTFDYTVNMQVTDATGLSSIASAIVTVNNIAPTVGTLTVSPEPSTEGSSVTVSATFTDPGVNDAPFACTVNYGDGGGDLPGAVSGNTCAGPAHAYPTFGMYTVAVSVTDKDGGAGSNSTTHTVIFNWSGFFPPVDNLPALNSVKAGSAIPVKFSLGDDKGLNIFAAGYPQSIQIACNTGELLGDPKPTANPGASSLSFGGGQYHYVWKTEKGWEGQCRQLVAKLIDGTEHRANFQFK